MPSRPASTTAGRTWSRRSCRGASNTLSCVSSACALAEPQHSPLCYPLIRRQLNLLYIRALILPQSVLIFDSAEGPESKLHKVIMNRLQVREPSYLLLTSLRPSRTDEPHLLISQRHLEEPSEEPFPFRVLESYLLSTASTLEAEVTLLRGQVQTLLSELEQEISRDSLKGLLSLGRDLTGLGERAGLVNDAVERCLNDGASSRMLL